MTLLRLATAFALSALVPVSGHAATNLVQNGDFLQSSGPVRQQIGAGLAGTAWVGTEFAHWTTSGYNFGFQWQFIDHYGSPGRFGHLKLWGTNDGGLDQITRNPGGGNIIAADGAFEVVPITQTVSGLTAGRKYQLDYTWAAGQQLNYDGATTGNWTASLGAQSVTTPTYHLASHAFSGWMHERDIFTAATSTAVLSFLAHGEPAGEPPFSLLSGVSLTAVPEASTWLMMVAGFGVIGIAARRRPCTARTVSA